MTAAAAALRSGWHLNGEKSRLWHTVCLRKKLSSGLRGSLEGQKLDWRLHLPAADAGTASWAVADQHPSLLSWPAWLLPAGWTLLYCVRVGSLQLCCTALSPRRYSSRGDCLTVESFSGGRRGLHHGGHHGRGRRHSHPCRPGRSRHGRRHVQQAQSESQNEWGRTGVWCARRAAQGVAGAAVGGLARIENIYQCTQQRVDMAVVAQRCPATHLSS